MAARKSAIPAPLAAASGDELPTRGVLPDGRPFLTDTFRDRQVRIVVPTPEALVVWRRVGRKLVDMSATELTDAQRRELPQLLDRVVTMIASLLLDEADKDWLENELLNGGLDLLGAAGLFSVATGNLAQLSDIASARKAPVRRPARRR